VDRATELQRLATADGHIARAMRHLTTQKAIIRHLEDAGHDTTLACKLLELFERTLKSHIEGRELVLAELRRGETQGRNPAEPGKLSVE
jgi:hypothetical protein